MKGSELIKMIQDQKLEEHEFCTVDRHEARYKKSATEIVTFERIGSADGQNFDTRFGFGHYKLAIVN